MLDHSFLLDLNMGLSADTSRLETRRAELRKEEETTTHDDDDGNWSCR